MKTILKPVALACLLALASSQGVMAAGGASGAAVKYAKQGQIGEVVNNPYRIAPLTAVIRSGGFQLEDVGWGAKFGSDDFELKGHLLSMVV